MKVKSKSVKCNKLLGENVDCDVPFNYTFPKQELTIEIVNKDVEQELGGIYAGEKIPAAAKIVYATEGVNPHLIINNNIPEFYYVFDFARSNITNSETWENNSNAETVENIITEEILNKYDV